MISLSSQHDYSNLTLLFSTFMPRSHKFFSQEEIAELGRIFTSFFDHSGKGYLSEVEFQKLMGNMGIEMSEQEAHGLVLAIGKSVEDDIGHGSEAKVSTR